MVEFSKFLKIVLIIDIIAGIFYAIMFLFLTNFWASMTDPPAFDLNLWRLWGGTCLSLSILGIIGLIRNEWTQFKMVLELVILWLIVSEIINLVAIIQIPRSPTSLVSQLADIIVILVLILLNAFAYFKEEKG